jgi:HK97 family phage major capsid protein
MNLKNQRAAELDAAKALVEKVKSAGRPLTADERATIEQHIKNVDAFDLQIRAANESMAVLKRISQIHPDLEHIEDTPDGEMFTEDQKSGLVRAARTKGSFGTLVKAPTLGGSLLPTTGTRVSDAPNALGARPLRGLFTEAVAGGPTVRYYTLSTGTAAVVPEGTLKPDAGVVTTAVDKPLVKIAATFQVSDELAEDAGFLINAIARAVTTGVLAKENQQIVAALGGTSGVVTATGDTDAAIDVFAGAIGQQEAVNGITPTALVINPTDLAVVRQTKASTGGTYFVDPLAAGPSAIHGVPLISSAATAAGTAYLVSSGAGVFYSRGGLRIESGFNGDDWSKNLMTVRVEERVLPAVVRPELITKVTLT